MFNAVKHPDPALPLYLGIACLLLDEPFSALDPLIRRKLQDELLALQERVRKTILFVSHDLDEALKLGDKVTILEGRPDRADRHRSRHRRTAGR